MIASQTSVAMDNAIAGANTANNGLNIMNSGINGANAGMDQAVSATNGLITVTDKTISTEDTTNNGVSTTISGTDTVNSGLENLLPIKKESNDVSNNQGTIKPESTEKSDRPNFTISVGYGGSVGLGIGVSGSAGEVMDEDGNVRGFATVGGGGTTPAFGYGWQVQITNANSLKDLKGWGVEGGGSAICAGVDGVVGKTYVGVQFTVGASNALAPLEVHGEATYTIERKLSSSDAEKAKNEINSKIEWLDQNLPNEVKIKINGLVGGKLFTIK